MRPEEELRADHMAMRRGVKMLDRLTSVLREGHGVRNTDLFTLVDVLDETAAEHHFSREEEVLFGFLRDRKARFGFDGLRSFHEEHNDLDDRLADIRELIEPATEGDQRARQQLEKAVDRYASALREHLKAEETTFLDRLHENLSTDEIEDLAEAMATADDAPKARARLEERLERLEDRYEDDFAG